MGVTTIGPDLVCGRLREQTGIAAVLAGWWRERRCEFDVERAISLTVAHRRLASGSDRAAERWRAAYRIVGANRLELHPWYRARAFLGEPLPQEPGTLGRPRCVKDRVEEALLERRRDLFTQVDRGFFDPTSIYFAGQGGQTLGRHGHSKDPRPDLPQRIGGFALDSAGWPLGCARWPGNTTDVKTLLPVVGRMPRRFRVRALCVLADRGRISRKVLAELEAAPPPGRYLLGARRRRPKEGSDAGLKTGGPWQEVHPERRSGQDPAPLKVRELRVQGRRYGVCLNEAERRKEAHDRAAIVAHLWQQLQPGDKSLVGNKGYRRYVKLKGTGHFAVDEDRLAAAARFDGLWGLRTNTDYAAPTVALQDQRLWRGETIIRTTQSILATRPIYHKCDETIRGHVFCSFLALWLKTELEQRLAEREQAWEWAEVVRGRDHRQEVEAVFRGRHHLLRRQFTGDAHKALRAAGVAVPPTIREL